MMECIVVEDKARCVRIQMVNFLYLRDTGLIIFGARMEMIDIQSFMDNLKFGWEQFAFIRKVIEVLGIVVERALSVFIAEIIVIRAKIKV